LHKAVHLLCRTTEGNLMTEPTNIQWHLGDISYKERCSLLGQRGQVLWLTGLSGSGKSTLSVEAEKMLFKMGRLAYRLDGDNIRFGLNRDLSFSPEDRMENIRRIAEVAKLFADAGIIVLVSFISPLIEMRQMARQIIGEDRFVEIYVKTRLETCQRRDPKGLYKKAIAGEIKEFTGISAPYEESERPDFVLDTDQNSIEENTRLLVECLT